ncbi:hypothetical protein [Oceanicoccus sagamiensis]|uniref:hypothetical protein n=1 Tax=Oceanicoccus sagamiensis TaxID=716816 RepID=UPI0026B5A60F
MYQKIGLIDDYFSTDTIIDSSNLGVFNISGKEEDRFKFKVPSLRHVVYTGPYFHDGSVRRLDKAIELMARHQLGVTVSDQEKRDIMAFFVSLSAPLPNDVQTIIAQQGNIN